MIVKSLLAGALALALVPPLFPHSAEPIAQPLPRRPSASGFFFARQVAPPPKDKLGAAAASVLFLEQPGIDGYCGGRDELVACATVGGGEMVLPNPCQARFAGESYAAVVCHEKAHILGWSHGK